MALAIDASTPAFASQATGAASITSASFSPPSNSLLVIGVGHSGSGFISATAMTDSLGSHLTYTDAVGVVEGGNHAYSDFWIAPVGSAPGAMTVTASWTGSAAFGDAMGILVLTGAAVSQVGAAQNTATAASGTPAAPSVAVTTTANGSWVFGFVTNSTSATAPTIPGGQTDTFNAQTMFAGPNAGFWLQGTSAPTSTSGTVVTINDTAPSVEFAMVALEILAPLVVVDPNTLRTLSSPRLV